MGMMTLGNAIAALTLLVECSTICHESQGAPDVAKGVESSFKHYIPQTPTPHPSVSSQPMTIFNDWYRMAVFIDRVKPRHN